MKGYKVFNSDWTCRGFQFEVGKVFEEDVTPICCDKGFHFCTKASDCFSYYDFDPNNKVAEVEALGEIDSNDEDSKCCTNKIKIVREINWQEVLELVNLGKACKFGNSGDCNSGNRNSGNRNSGNRNSGDWNKTCFSNGCFNTESPKIYLFNKPSNWNYSDWLNSDARYILMNCPSNVLSWIWEDDMTDEETGRQMWWDGLSDVQKDSVMQLPNFDKDIFKEITGISIEA